jgi:hypothetical protein
MKQNALVNDLRQIMILILLFWIPNQRSSAIIYRVTIY